MLEPRDKYGEFCSDLSLQVVDFGYVSKFSDICHW